MTVIGLSCYRDSENSIVPSSWPQVLASEFSAETTVSAHCFFSGWGTEGRQPVTLSYTEAVSVLPRLETFISHPSRSPMSSKLQREPFFSQSGALVPEGNSENGGRRLCISHRTLTQGNQTERVLRFLPSQLLCHAVMVIHFLEVHLWHLL